MLPALCIAVAFSSSISTGIPQRYPRTLTVINETDLTHVWVINPDDDDDIYKLDPVDEDLQAGLSLEFWRSYRKQLEELEESTGHPAIAADIRAETAMRLIEEAKTGKGATKRRRVRLAHAATQELENLAPSQSIKPSADIAPRINVSSEETTFDYSIED